MKIPYSTTFTFIFLFLEIFIFILLFSYTISPVIPCWSLDSHMFQELGLSILHGKTPYIDLFDQKGFYLFLYNALGLCINRVWGLPILQSLNFLACILLIIASIEIISETRLGIWKRVVVAFCFLCLDFGFEGGNACEECNFLFIILPIYLSIKSIWERTFELGIYELFCIGGCAGCTLFIRANNYMPVLGFLLVILAINLYRKKYKYCLRSIGIVFAGFITLLLPCLLFFGLKGGMTTIDEMWYGTFTSNVEYAVKDSLLDQSLLFLLKSYFCNLFLMLVSILLWRKSKSLSVAFLLSILLGSLSVGRALYRHYFIVFIPLYCILTFSIWELHKNRLLGGLSFLIVLLICINPGFRYFDLVKSRSPETVRCREEFSRVIENIPESDRQKIWNLNAMSGLDLLVSQDIIQMNRFMVPWHADFFSRFKDSETVKFQAVHPKWVLLDRKFPLRKSDHEMIAREYLPIDSLTRKENGSNYVILKSKL